MSLNKPKWAARRGQHFLAGFAVISLTVLAWGLMCYDSKLRTMTRTAQDEQERLTAYMLSTVPSAWCLEVPVAKQDGDFVILELRTYLDSMCENWGTYAAVDSRTLDLTDGDRLFGCLESIRRLGFFTVSNERLRLARLWAGMRWQGWELCGAGPPLEIHVSGALGGVPFRHDVCISSLGPPLPGETAHVERQLNILVRTVETIENYAREYGSLTVPPPYM